MTEKQLIKACQGYDKRSQFELVKRYSGMLMTVCRRYVSDQSSAKDVLQESLIIIFSNIQKYKAIGSFEAWMRKITMRCALNYLKKNKTKHSTLLLDTDNRTIEPDAYLQMDKEVVVQLIQKLPEAYRLVFNLNVIEGYSHREIAELLDIQESSSRSRLTRAKMILRDQVSQKSIKNQNAI